MLEFFASQVSGPQAAAAAALIAVGLFTGWRWGMPGAFFTAVGVCGFGALASSAGSAVPALSAGQWCASVLAMVVGGYIAEAVAPSRDSRREARIAEAKRTRSRHAERSAAAAIHAIVRDAGSAA